MKGSRACAAAQLRESGSFPKHSRGRSSRNSLWLELSWAGAHCPPSDSNTCVCFRPLPYIPLPEGGGIVGNVSGKPLEKTVSFNGKYLMIPWFSETKKIPNFSKHGIKLCYFYCCESEF